MLALRSNQEFSHKEGEIDWGKKMTQHYLIENRMRKVI